MDFTIDDMIEFCESELDYHSKEADKRKEMCFANETPERNSYMLGHHIGFKIAYINMLESLIELKKSQNKKIKKIIDWCQEEIDICINIKEDEYTPSWFKDIALSKKTSLDAVKNKLCNIYEGDIANEKTN